MFHNSWGVFITVSVIVGRFDLVELLFLTKPVAQTRNLKP